jgi:HD-GYP domain-containing protein (c-di-GMP phosphodiesterase class II)
MANGPIVMPRSLSPESLRVVDAAAQLLVRQFGRPFRFFDIASLDPVPVGIAEGDPPAAEPWVCELVRGAACDSHAFTRPISDRLHALVLPLRVASVTEFAAVGVFASVPLHGTADERHVTEQLGDAFGCDAPPFCEAKLLARLGDAVLCGLSETQQLRLRTEEINQMASQVARNYEEITLLYRLTREAHVSHGTRNVQELALSLLGDVLPARQLMHVRAREDAVLSHGDALLSAACCRRLIEKSRAAALDRPLVENHVAALDWGDEFESLERFVIVPIVESGERFGWLLALNTMDGSELGSIEASLMTAVAAILGTHEMHVKLFRNIEELFLGVVHALSSAIDAKDPYTCGHSDRVARVASRLGRELGLPEDEMNLLYLSGLLHDVGKIGIRDYVLLKPGRLTDAEFEHIKEHPKIGFDILSAVRQLAPILPGVRNHHEHIDGTGYPDALKGAEIPLMARILAVADAYDAMSSDRPYRQGMASSQVEEIFRDGAGRQWDSRVVAALLAVREEIARLFARRSDQAFEAASEPEASEKSESVYDQIGLRKISKLLTLGQREAGR